MSLVTQEPLPSPDSGGRQNLFSRLSLQSLVLSQSVTSSNSANCVPIPGVGTIFSTLSSLASGNLSSVVGRGKSSSPTFSPTTPLVSSSFSNPRGSATPN